MGRPTHWYPQPVHALPCPAPPPQVPLAAHACGDRAQRAPPCPRGGVPDLRGPLAPRPLPHTPVGLVGALGVNNLSRRSCPALLVRVLDRGLLLGLRSRAWVTAGESPQGVTRAQIRGLHGRVGVCGAHERTWMRLRVQEQQRQKGGKNKQDGGCACALSTKHTPQSSAKSRRCGLCPQVDCHMSGWFVPQGPWHPSPARSCA